MKKILTLLLLTALFIGCSSDDDKDEINIINPNAELIFNEPLIMFGKTLDEVRAAEKRELVEGTTSTYKEVKGDLQYMIIYGTTNGKVDEIQVTIENQPIDRYDETVASLSKKYRKNENKDQFNADTYYIYPQKYGVINTIWFYFPRNK
ncbi:hypothetical protein [Dysgonomonas sp. GY617]|uniref:hypothetical protein n=1 Tax=Dysgonomonas sp. GY617 TaxID=2780420 RepID=UPI001883200F|nr:hypothetical protein [Dysgonomonas sp. GY617]MBF0577745.1 hypothetical protein [Dysgonomonas sp. GY617]